jgi:uncharacterized protein (UPF0332 family)
MQSASYNPDRFLSLAEKLIYDKNYEEQSRSRVVVGRAYYTAFLKTQKKLMELGYSLNNATRIHKQVIDLLRDIKPDLGDKFSSLFDKRVDADYYMDTDIRLESGKMSLRTAQSIIRDLPNLKKN